MKNEGYVIKSYLVTSKGTFENFLGKDSIWYVAANDCHFKTLKEARRFFKTSNHELRGSAIWIEGPRGGRHRLFGDT